MFDNVVVGIEREDAGRDAVALAAELARPEGELTLVYVHVVGHKPAVDSGAVADAAHRSYAVERLAALRDEVRIAAHVASVDARSARAGLHGFTARRHADLIVLGASRRDPVGRELVGDDTREVLEDPPCPVALAPGGYSEIPAALRKIGVGYDGSPEGEDALAVARKLAADRGATVSAFQAVPAPLYVRDVRNADSEIEECVEAARRRIAALGGVEPHAEFDDDVVEALRRFGTSVDLLVVGSHRSGPLGRVTEQSTAQRLADDVSCALLVLRPRGRRETGGGIDETPGRKDRRRGRGSFPAGRPVDQAIRRGPR